MPVRTSASPRPHRLRPALAAALAAGLVWAGAPPACRGATQASAAPARAVAGVMHLSEEHLSRNGVVWLDGEWAFYWGRLLEPADFHAGGPPPDAYAAVPGPWTRLRPAGRPLPDRGYATYRLEIRLPRPPEEPLALAVGYVCSAYRLWADGELVASNGRVGTSPEQERPQYLPVRATFSPRGSGVELVLQVSNFYHRCNGIWSRIAFGKAGALERREQWRLGQGLFLLGGILIMALYHVALYLLRRSERSALYFGLFCLVIALRSTVTGEELWLRAMPELPTGFELRVEYLANYVALPLFLLLLNGLYPREVSPRAVKLSGAVAAGGLGSLAAPAYLASWVTLAYEGVLVGFVAYVLGGMITAARRGRDGASVFLGGVAAFFAALVNDLLKYNHLALTVELLPLGLFALILAQSVLLARRFSRAFTELQQSRRMLTEREEQLRREIAEMLHGGVQTRLLVASHQLAGAEDALPERPDHAAALLSSARKVLEEVREGDVRAVSHLLHPSIIRVGLVPAVRSLAGRFGDRLDVQVQVGDRLAALDSVADNRIPESIRLAAYRVLEEALNNVAAHARASRAELQLDVTADDSLLLVVRDDGSGFDPAQMRPGLGLRSIGARVSELDGTWDIASRPGHGTTLVASIPLTSRPAGSGASRPDTPAPPGPGDASGRHPGRRPGRRRWR